MKVLELKHEALARLGDVSYLQLNPSCQLTMDATFLDNNAVIKVLVGFLESTGEAEFHN